MRIAWMAALLLATTPAWADDPPAAKKEPAKEAPKAKPGVVAHIKLGGSLSEAPVGESLFGDTGENLKAKLDRIRKAKNDKDVKALLLQIDDPSLGLMSFGVIHEVQKALEEFKTSGKPVTAYFDEVGGLEYLLALPADEIVVAPPGTFSLLGVRMETIFFKEIFDKYGLRGDFLTMGDAKGAADPFLRTDLSPENKKQYDLMLDDYFGREIVANVAKYRGKGKFTPESVKKLIDTAPHAAPAAVEAGLFDRAAYFDEVRDGLTKKFEAKFSEDYAKPKSDDVDPLSAVMKAFAGGSKKRSSSKPKIAVIYAVGEIVTGKGGPSLMGGSRVGSATMVEAIEKADKDATVKAIVLRIDSPGGSALASDLIWNALKKCKKPVVASMGDVAASGGYYIAMGAGKVYAAPGTLTGSIGVVGGKIVYGPALDRLGLKTQTLSRGERANAMSSDTPFSDSEREGVRKEMQYIYDVFLDRVVAQRTAAGVKMTKETLLPLAGGRIWTGEHAKQRGLVDELGGFDAALADAKAKGGFKPDETPELMILPEPGTGLDNLLGGIPGLSLKLDRLPPAAVQALRAVEAMMTRPRERVWLWGPLGVGVR